MLKLWYDLLHLFCVFHALQHLIIYLTDTKWSPVRHQAQ